MKRRVPHLHREEPALRGFDYHLAAQITAAVVEAARLDVPMKKRSVTVAKVQGAANAATAVIFV